MLTLWPPGPDGAEDVDPDVVLGDVDVVGLLDHRQHLDAGERRLAAALVVERRDAHQPVGALLDRERAVGVGRLDREGRRLDAGLLGVRRVVDLGRVAVALGPAQVHPHQHLGQVGGVDAAGLGADGHQGLARVVLAGQQGADLELADASCASAASSGSASASVSGVALVLGQLEQHREVVEAPAQGLDPGQLALHVREPAGDLLRVLLVVPEVGRGGLLVEVGQVSRASRRGRAPSRCCQGLVELLELFCHVDGCHVQ